MAWDGIAIFVALAALVTVLGFVAARWQRGDLNLLDEWGLGGRRFGTVVTWFLLGGDLYTAYTFVAVPALVAGSGGLGIYALTYSIISFPIAYATMPKLWRVAKNRGYVTAADYVKDRFDSRLLALLVAITGIVATMPYVALQIFGIAVVIHQMGVNVDAALVASFLVLAVFTYVSGLRAPALIAFVKDSLLWIAVLVIVVVVPLKLGGYGAIFSKVPQAKLIPPPGVYAGYATLALGSAFALFLYPHAITANLASRSDAVIKRNTAILPAYTFMLGMIALMGFMALAAGFKPSPPYGANAAVPQLIDQMFPSSFSGFAFAAIAIGALVPASVMSIAAANLFNRNIYREFFRPSISPKEETRVSQIVSLLVKLGALLFVASGQSKQAINLQLAGGIWMMQTLPAVFLALYVRWLDRWGVIAGWAVGMAFGTYWVVQDNFASTLHRFPLAGGSIQLYGGLVAFALNLAVVVVWSLIVRAVRGRGEPAGQLSERDYQVAGVE
ncbi:MAG TPA: sodium:solute symporter [Candidatus Binatia bacterium]|nr:sodium:solute symporter [Candidatus Binatia bacterium]